MQNTPHTTGGIVALVSSFIGFITSCIPFLETSLRLVALVFSIAASWLAMQYYRDKKKESQSGTPKEP